MFTIVIVLSISICISETSSIILLGPASLGFFSSRRAGGSIIKIRLGAPRIITAVSVGDRFEIIIISDTLWFSS